MTVPTIGAAGNGPVETADPSQVIAQNTSQAVGDLSSRMGGVDPQMLGSILDAVVGGYLNGDGALMSDALGAYTQLASAVQAAQISSGGQQAMPLPSPVGESAPPAASGPTGPSAGAAPAGAGEGAGGPDPLEIVSLLLKLLASLPSGDAQEVLKQLAQLPPDQLGQALTSLAQNGGATSGPPD
ncbi:MAG: hypothetical protein ACREXP_25865, partial [Steroidobacteraceae bacterium]